MARDRVTNTRPRANTHDPHPHPDRWRATASPTRDHAPTPTTDTGRSAARRSADVGRDLAEPDDGDRAGGAPLVVGVPGGVGDDGVPRRLSLFSLEHLG